MGQALLRRRSGEIKGNPPSDWVAFKSFLNSTSWECPASAWYRIYCIGKCGNGGNGGSSHANIEGRTGGSGAGGNSGAVAISDIYIKKGEIYQITITTSLSSFGDKLSAQAGADGGAGGYIGTGTISLGRGGVASSATAYAYGGNVLNASGYKGGNGYGRGTGDWDYLSAEQGGNNGGVAKSGGGGARLYSSGAMSKYVIAVGSDYLCGGNSGVNTRNGGTYKPWTFPRIELTGAGGGGKGAQSGSSTNDYVGPGAGGQGQPGLVIIDRGATA